MSRVPPHLLAALVPLLVLLVALDVYCLVDLARSRSMPNGVKVVWAIVIVFVSAPLGALLYLLLGRDRGRGRRGAQAPAGVQQGTRHDQPDHGEQGNAGHGDARRTPQDRQPIVTSRGLTETMSAPDRSTSTSCACDRRGPVARQGDLTQPAGTGDGWRDRVNGRAARAAGRRPRSRPRWRAAGRRSPRRGCRDDQVGRGVEQPPPLR
jgi:hypothetical protein